VPADLVPLLALVVLLAVAYAHPRGRVEAAVGLAAATATLATGALGRHALAGELRRLGPVVGFLVAILVVAECCRTAGVFAALGARLGRVRSRQRLLVLTFVAAVVVTVVLSLDATVVLLTPVVLAATGRRFVAAELACVRLANSASLLVPVANLTNLLALHQLDLTFARFTVLMAPSWLAVLLVEYVVLRVGHRGELRLVEPERDGPLPPVPVLPVVVVALMLAGFVLTSPLGLPPVWVAAAAALLLAAHGLARGMGSPTHLAPTNRTSGVPDVWDYRLTGRQVAASMHLGFAVFVLCLGVVVAGLGAGWFGARVADLVPHRSGLAGLLLVAALGAALANVVNNLPATLLLVPLVAPLGTTSLLALLIGVNVGSSLTWTGSLANLLWRRTLAASGRTAPSRDFHRTALVASPAAIVAAVVVLWAWAPVA
jgi:arsenical pump membrane protein